MIALSGASFPIKSSIFSEISNTTTIRMISSIEKKKVPRNLRMIYLSINFKGFVQGSKLKSSKAAPLLNKVKQFVFILLLALILRSTILRLTASPFCFSTHKMGGRGCGGGLRPPATNKMQGYGC